MNTASKVKWSVIIAALAALAVSVAVYKATAETYPQLVANDATTGLVRLEGEYKTTGQDSLSIGAFRRSLIHFRAGSSGASFSVWNAFPHFAYPDSVEWTHIAPPRGAAAGDTVYQLEANEKVTLRFTQRIDGVYISAGGGDVWAE